MAQPYRKQNLNYMGRAKPDVRPPVAAIPSAKSIYVVEIPLVAIAVGGLPLLREEFGLLN